VELARGSHGNHGSYGNHGNHAQAATSLHGIVVIKKTETGPLTYRTLTGEVTAIFESFFK